LGSVFEKIVSLSIILILADVHVFALAFIFKHLIHVQFSREFSLVHEYTLGMYVHPTQNI